VHVSDVWARERVQETKKVCSSSSSFAPRPDVVEFFRVIMNGQLFFLVSCCINVACAVTCADELGFPFWLKIKIKRACCFFLGIAAQAPCW
jgi:hypothetical protein